MTHFDLFFIKDVAAATFMAVASTTPELFTNLISTFIADSDMGLGTIIGSMMFNTLGVAACAGLAAIKPVQLDWFPMARDCLIYSINIITLVVIAWDGQVMWWETVILFIFFIMYFMLLSQNSKIERLARLVLQKKLGCCKVNSYGKCNDSLLSAAITLRANTLINHHRVLSFSLHMLRY